MAGCVVVKFVVFSLVLLEYASTSTYCRSVDQNQMPGKVPREKGSRTDKTMSYPWKRRNHDAVLYQLQQNEKISASNPWELITSNVVYPWYRKNFTRVSHLREKIDNKELLHIAERNSLSRILYIWQQINLRSFLFRKRLNISDTSKEYLRHMYTINRNFNTLDQNGSSRMRDAKLNSESLHFSLVQRRMKEKTLLKLVEDMNKFLFSRNLASASDSRNKFQSHITPENVSIVNGGGRVPIDWDDWDWFRTTRKPYPWETSRRPFPWETTRRPYPWEVTDDPWRPNRYNYDTDYSIGTVLLMVFGIPIGVGLLYFGIKYCIEHFNDETESSSTTTRFSGLTLHLPPEIGTRQEAVTSFTNPAAFGDAEISMYASDSFRSPDGSRARINTEASGQAGDRPPDYSAVVISDLVEDRPDTYGVVVPKPLDSPPPNYDIIQLNSSDPPASL